MDSEFRKNIERLERAVEVAHEEQISGDQMAQTVLLAEEVEEKQRIIRRLQQQIRVWRWVSLVALFVWVVILLYACAAVIIYKEPEIREHEVSYNLDMPDIDLNDVNKCTLDELTIGLSEGMDFIDYLGSRYTYGDKAGSTVVWSIGSLSDVISATNRSYTIDGKASESASIKKYVEVGCSVHHFMRDSEGGYQELPEDFYYNYETIEASGLNDPDLSEYISTTTQHMTLEIYNSDDVDVEQEVLRVLESRLYGESMDGLVADVAGAFDECIVTVGDEVVDTTKEGGHPKVIDRYKITVTDHIFNIWVCTAKGGWYESD